MEYHYRQTNYPRSIHPNRLSGRQANSTRKQMPALEGATGRAQLPCAWFQKGRISQRVGGPPWPVTYRVGVHGAVIHLPVVGLDCKAAPRQGQAGPSLHHGP